MCRTSSGLGGDVLGPLPRQRTRRRDSVAAGFLAACVVIGTYLVGAGRAFGYDASVTVANFVRTPSLLDPLRRQVVYNNHVAFSFLEHVIYTVSGSSSERTMRVL